MPNNAAEILEGAREQAVDRFGLMGRKCLVTGGTKGIGRAIVEEFSRLGAQVYTCARNEEDLVRRLEDWQSRGYNVQGLVADVSKREQCEQLLEEVKQHFHGELHVLVNNVGTNIRKASVEYTQQDYSTIMSTNLEASFVLCQLAHPLLKASRNASVLHISSVAGGPTANRAGPLYSMSKAAMNQLARNLACEWAGDEIRVNSLAPWVTLTELGMQNLKDEEWKSGVLARTPMGRLAQPEDISGVAAFLCSPAASYITGQTLAVDGGYSVMGFW